MNASECAWRYQAEPKEKFVRFLNAPSGQESPELCNLGANRGFCRFGHLARLKDLFQNLEIATISRERGCNVVFE